MVELILAWIFLFIGFARGDAEWFIASGVFAVAAQISRLVDRK